MMFYSGNSLSFLRIIFILVYVILAVGCSDTSSVVILPQDRTLPLQSEWVDYGTIFEAGAPGEWDHYLWGGFALSAIKKDNTYYLYYQGASGYRTDFDETVMWRAIGVATSQDGVHFSKYEDNPVITWVPNKNGEEGAVSSGVTLGENGEVILFYGANTQESITTINADVRVASSIDGFTFDDLGIMLDHTDRGVWGSGDELFSVDAIYGQGRWVVYYIPNGTIHRGKLGVAYGTLYDQLGKTSAVKSGPDTISVWGTAGHARVAENTYALILNNVRENRTEIRLTTLDMPNKISEPVATYRFDDVHQATILLDEDRRTWFLYYRVIDGQGEINHYGVKLAPVGERDLSPPSPPQGLEANFISDHLVELAWEAAEDPDTGILQYSVYRNGELVDVVGETGYTDRGLIAKTTYRYQVSAVNYHGVEGPLSSPVVVKIP